MDIEIQARPAASIARLQLAQGEVLTCEVGAMIAMSSGFTAETRATQRGKGGLLKGIKRMLGGENLFLNYFTAEKPNQTIIVGPGLLGDIVHHRLNGGTIIVQGSSWLASTSGIDIDATWQGLTRGLLSGERMFWVKCSGTGDVLLNSFGAIYEVQVTDSYVVDTGHIVAFEDTLQFDMGKAGKSVVGSFLGGEGFVCKFRGQGKVYCQSHNPPSFGKVLGPKLRPR